MNKEESIGDSVVENENVAINQDEIDTSESSVENQVNVSSDIEEAQQGAKDDLRTNEEQKIHEDLVYDHEDDLQQETLETIEDTVEIEPEEQEYEVDQHVSIDQEVFTAQEEVENDQDQYADQQEVVEQADDYEEQQQEVEEIGDQKGEYIEAQQEDADSDEHINIREDKDEAQEEIVNEANNKRSDVADDKINESEEEDFDNVVEVDEDKAESDNEDENVAQHVSDSENEDEPKTEDIKLGDVSDDDLRGASSGSENEASEDDNISVPKKKNAIASSDDEEEPNQESKEGTHHQEAVLKMFDSDSEEEQKDEGVGDLIADIFGESDDEEEFTGFGQEEISKKDEKKSSPISESEDERSERESEDEGDTVSQETPAKPVSKEGSDSDGDGGDRGLSDFDLMMKKKKEENGRHRRRRDGGTYISDADDIINAMLTKMKEAAEGDRDANLKRQPALKKLKLLKSVVVHLRKQDLKESFVDNGVIAAIADWLSLLPDRSLPHITIRTELLQILHDLPTVSAETLKHSGIGKAVMILFKHPREIRKNRESAGRLINKWSRPIFGLNENFKSMTREEREQRDLDQMPQAKRRRLSSGAQAQTEEGREGELGLLRPGEQGFVMRARVPMPSTKDYVVRPKWNVEGTMFGEEEGEWPKKSTSSTGAPRSSKKDERLEKHMRNFAERRKNSKMQRAVNISIEGNKMNI